MQWIRGCELRDKVYSWIDWDREQKSSPVKLASKPKPLFTIRKGKDFPSWVSIKWVNLKGVGTNRLLINYKRKGNIYIEDILIMQITAKCKHQSITIRQFLWFNKLFTKWKEQQTHPKLYQS